MALTDEDKAVSDRMRAHADWLRDHTTDEIAERFLADVEYLEGRIGGDRADREG